MAKARRRASGEGSVYQRTSDGLWTGVVSMGYRNGKRYRLPVYARTQGEALEKFAALRRARDLGLLVGDDRQTLADFLAQWLDHERLRVRPRTHESYRWAISHVVPSIGPVRLGKLRANHVQSVLTQAGTSGLSRRSTEYVWQVLRRALKVAVTWGLCGRNVADLVQPPRPERQEVRPLTASELRSLLEAARDTRLEAAVVLTGGCGLRRGEVLALRWVDIDLDAARLRVKGTLQRVDGQLQVGEPKSKKSRRSVALPLIAVDALRRRRAEQARDRLRAGIGWQDLGFVFTTSDGRPLEPRNLLRSWHRLLDQVGLDRRPLHDARHAAASLMLSEGVPIKIVQETLGHSTMRLTADLYGHLMPGDEERAASAVDRALGALGTY